MSSYMALLFFLIALLYSSAGFGGGSLYLAVLGQSMPAGLLRPVALLCNLIVTGTSTIQNIRKGLVSWKRVWPLLAVSVPASLIGAQLVSDERTFFMILGSALILAGGGIFLQSAKKMISRTPPHRFILLPGVAAIGLLAGMTGIGGGVYLSPVLYYSRWGSEREIAVVSSLFIVSNSLAGLAGLMLQEGIVLETSSYYLMMAVFAGGWIGSRLSLAFFSRSTLRWMTAAILIFAGLRILIKYW